MKISNLITVKAYRKFMVESNFRSLPLSWNLQDECSDYPVTGITWDDVLEYTKFYSKYSESYSEIEPISESLWIENYKSLDGYGLYEWTYRKNNSNTILLPVIRGGIFNYDNNDASFTRGLYYALGRSNFRETNIGFRVVTKD